MARKKKSTEDLVLESFGGNRKETELFRMMTDDEFIGYVTGIVLLQNPSSGASPIVMLLEVRRLFVEGKL